jgi:hypothetical protein
MVGGALKLIFGWAQQKVSSTTFTFLKKHMMFYFYLIISLPYFGKIRL